MQLKVTARWSCAKIPSRVRGSSPATTREPDRGGDYLCPFCPESGQQLQILTSMPTVNGNPWSALAVVHPNPIYHVEGDPGRAGNGLYDTMQSVGAHEVIVENARHDRQLWNSDDREIEQYLALCAPAHPGPEEGRALQVRQRLQELRQLHSGQEFDHPTSEIVATTFVPRRVLYELRAAREHYR